MFLLGNVAVEATCQLGGEDFVDKDIKLLEEDPTYHEGPYHLKNGDGHYIIVLKGRVIDFETLQPNTQPCKS